MADELQHSTTISKRDTRFPPYLDFDTLRAEGIEYLGKLSGQIWSDHNVHDPGITILEMLCYALLDLGYRTNLPLEDILTRNPDDTGPDYNFFTPARILACNPLTITDFRKLLIDLEGVRNAWLEPATDITDFCRPRRPVPDDDDDDDDNNDDIVVEREDENGSCESFLNGLYHVYLDLEKDIDSFGEINSDFENEEQANDYKKRVIRKVRNSLMAHRNLCEDFADIYILCKLPMGVCAEIDLDENVKAEDIYITIAEELREFFTPAPRFYTLQQLLEKQVPMEEIFAGRPYNHTQSHGFVDIKEFEEIKLKKEIHLSDVYEVLFNVPGVRSVRHLSLRLCNGGTGSSQWKFPIKKNHIPQFDVRCSGFRFTREGMPLFVDFDKYQRLFDLNFSHSGKVLYKSPSPYLDAEIPKGVYRTDLAHYYSIQNEFPRVYAIEEGGLADDAPDLRKAQALQLKGYLLFFDQLLANYLSQLSNLRSLFALASPENEDKQHTYFINQLETVPELQKLLRFHATGNGGAGGLDAAGSTLVFPVDKNKLLAFKESGQLKYFDVEKAEPTAFESQAEKDIVVSQLKDDLYNEVYSCEIINKTDDCVFYYILTSSEDVALLSRNYFKNTREAKQNAATVKYIGVFDENYRSFTDSSRHFSFTIDLNVASFARYLQLVTEDRALYLERRQGFLHHLLARFAEKFTDYALLTFGNTSNEEIEEAKIQASEKFLTHYDDISSNRGKGYDYYVDRWNNENVSGFEKRVKSLSGIENWKRRSLCNFEVSRYDEQYAVTLKIADRNFFTLRDTYDSPEEAGKATQTFFAALSDRKLYRVQHVPREQTYVITIRKDDRILATYPEKYETETEAQTAIQRLHRLFSANPPRQGDIFVSQFMYYLQLRDYRGNPVLTSAKSYDTEAVARSVVTQLKQGINDEDRWQPEGELPAPAGMLYRIPHLWKSPLFIDLDAFKIDIDNTLVGKPDQFSYDLLDIRNRFKFRPLEEFDSEKKARDHWRQLLGWMANAKNYRIRTAERPETFSLYIVVEQEDKAILSENFDNDREARQAQNMILSLIRQHLYTLIVCKVPFRWKFAYGMDLGETSRFLFESIDDYESTEEAFAAATRFTKYVSKLQVRKYGEEFRLVPIKPPEETTSARLTQQPEEIGEESLRAEMKQELYLQTEVNRLHTKSTPKDFAASVDLDTLSRQGLYVYRLIDQDTIPARYSEAFADRSSTAGTLKKIRNTDCGDYSALEICLGGDIFNKRIDEDTGTAWYHYLIRSRNRFDPSGDERVLFESALGYHTQEEAQEAFEENYLRILDRASLPENYGTTISLEETVIHQPDDCFKKETVVFVPQAARDEWGDETIHRLAALAKSYPIRLTDTESESFYLLFPCEEKPEKPKERVCKPAEPNYVYYFRLYYTEPGEGDLPPYWQSTGYFTSPEEARREYRFFRMLLCYPGNFFIQCNPCHEDAGSYGIYLREVLAESTGRFPTKEAAWGKEGVQKFICISQSKNAFHLYQRKSNCCYTFYIACANSVVYHPCHYDTPEKRDQVLEKLFREFYGWHKTRAWQFDADKNKEREGYVLLNDLGEPFASVPFRDQDDLCEEWITFISKAMRKQLQYETDEGGLFYAYDDESGLTVYSYDTNVEEEGWKKTLQTFACYFPIVKRTHEKTGQGEYCIEIKLPGFSSCGSVPDEDKPCGCNGREKQPEPICFTAWKSRCCFDTCEEAQVAWREIMKLLLRYENYRPLFDCECYDFSLALHYGSPEGTPEIVGRGGFNPADSEMVALNPQCYTTPDEVCAAMERAWKLINAEGLHVAEHILLRPRCREDCRCEQYSDYCENETGCDFVWSETDVDPCADQPDVCFTPGTDPYSFIATVALPAWPVRFRNPDNRRLLEHILYREAPAHVLLRILWLAPHDFCCFENDYRQLGRWLGRKETCLEDFNRCDFLAFLFDRNYECLDECESCQPCGEEEYGTDFCSENWLQEPMSDPYKYLNQINELYCWREQLCDEYEFRPCKSETSNGETDDVDVILHSRRTTPVEAQTHPEEAAERDVLPLKPKPQVVNSRMTRYRTEVDRVLEASGQHPLAGKAQAFVNDPQPSPERTSNLLEEVAQNKKPEKGKKLGEEQVAILLQNILCYYLDKVCFDGKDPEKIKALRPALENLARAQANLDLSAMYAYWEPDQVRLYEPGTDIAVIRKIITGRG